MGVLGGLLLVEVTQVQVGAGQPRRYGKGLLKVCFRRSVVPLLRLNHAHQVQRVGIFGRSFQDFTQLLARLGQVAFLDELLDIFE